MSEPKEVDVNLEREKIMELNEFRESSGSESSDPGLKQSIFEDEEKFTAPFGNMERDVQEEDHINKLDQTLGESKKEFMKVEEMLVEVQTADPSHQISDSYHTTENVSLPQKINLEAIDPCGEVTKATGEVDHDLSHEPLSEIEILKDRENIKDQDVIPVEDHKVGQNIQEEDNDNRNLEEAGPKLDVEDQNDFINDVNQSMTETNVNREMPRGIERVDESENVEKQSIEEEAACVEVSADNTLVKEVKDSDSISAEQTTETTDNNEVTKTRTLAQMEDQNDANADTEAPKEEILKQEDSEKLEDVSKVVSEVSEDNMKNETKEEGDDTTNVLQISPTMVTEKTSITNAENEDEKIVEVFHTGTEVESLKMDETIDTCDDNDKTILEKTSDMVSQLQTDEYENRDQKSVIVEKNINDILESDIPVKNTEESFEEDKQCVEPVIPDENIKPAEVENLEETIDNINTKHSSAENVSMGEAGEQHKEKSDFESGTDKVAFQSVSEDQIPKRIMADEVEFREDEDTDTTIVGVESVKETFQEDNQGEYIKEANCESKAEDDKSKRIIEASETTKNETTTEKLPKQPENASATENNERQVLGKEQSVNHSGQVTYDEKSIKGKHDEDEGKKDDVQEEATTLVAEEQIPESNAEKVLREAACEAKEAPKTEFSNEEMMKGGLLKDQIPVREISVQENNHGEETKEAEVEEQSPTLVPEKLHDESKDVRHEEGKTNATTKEEVNQMQIKSSDLMLVEQDISQEAEKTKTVDVEEGKSWKPDNVPVKTAPSQETPNELLHETIARHLESKEIEAEIATDSEDFVDLNKTSNSNFGTVSIIEKLHIKEDLPTDVLDASSVVKVSQEEIQEKEGQSTDSEEKQEVVLVKKETMEPNIPTEDNGKNIGHQAPVPDISNEGGEKIDDLNIQQKLGANEEGVLPLLKQDETPPDVKILDKSSDVIDEKKISEGDNTIAGKEETISIKSIEVPSLSGSLNESSLKTAEGEEGTQREAQRTDREVVEVECEADQKVHNFDEETKLDSKSSGREGAQLFDLLIISRKDTEQAGGHSQEEGNPLSGKEEMENKEALTVKEEHKTNEKETDEEGEEEDEQKKEDSGSDAPVMVEASRDIDVKITPKKSHNILSGVGSKVKHSISKVKKAITGKSSNSKQLTPK
ncbi:hypothetical protein AQUCO_01100545v1 [Aquilegia coerulea]|uniref:Uncharacterized protein n=1 Tax=Aquilegia coerulea TaxID=218851 RepID=A0A2G5E7R1_AQUCA|nr:hypothetical protein AQUCO_01100545v1 [Aquilegia coerulea]